MSFVHRGAVALALSALVVTTMAPAVADDLAIVGDELNASGALDLGDVCRGATSVPGALRFALERRGDPNNQTWASSVSVNITGSAAAGPSGTLTLGRRSATTPSDWATVASKGDNYPAGTAAVSVSVPAGAPLGSASVGTTWTATGAGHQTATVTKDDTVTVTWKVVTCAPVDSTPPNVAYTLTPTQPDGSNGWYRQDVSVDWSVSDGESAATPTGCLDETLSTNGTHTSTCSATSAGGTASDAITVKRDATPPSVTAVPNGILGSNGWYDGDVTVSWTVSDATSGLDPSTTCPAATLTEDSAARTFTCTIRDLAGNQTVGTITVKRDATDPMIASTLSGALGQFGWYTGDVTIDWTVTDATSQVASKTGCTDMTVMTDTGTSGATYTCSATDNAGNAASDSVTVKRDTTAPSISFTPAGTLGDNGWYTSNVGLTWNVADTGGSGLASSTGCGPQTISADGSPSFTCGATDVAGNPASATAQIDKDATAPIITPTVTGPTKGTSWYTGDVKVTWAVTDATSGVATESQCDAADVTEDTAGTSFTCTSTDLAGNTDSDTVTVKRDATAPVVTFTGGPVSGSAYHFGDPIPGPSTCTATETMSGLAGGCTVTGGGSAVATHVQTGSATDVAGNVGVATRTYTVLRWTLDGFYRPVVMDPSVDNTVKAGSTVPLKFNVLKGTAPMSSGIGAKFTAARISCEVGDAEDPVDFVTTGGTSLRYDEVGKQWVQNWATPAAGKGSCYRVTMTTADGSSITADFKLK